MLRCTIAARCACPDARYCEPHAVYCEGSECDKFNQKVDDELNQTIRERLQALDKRLKEINKHHE